MPELRRDPFSRLWVAIPTDRVRRPADFLREPVPSVPTLNQPGGEVCPFCEGNEAMMPSEIASVRACSGPDQKGWSLRVVPSRMPVLSIEGSLEPKGDGLFDSMRGVGAHEVIVETPSHALSVTDLDESEIERVFAVWRDRMRDLRRDFRLEYAHIFKNFGVAAGAVVEHNHSQLLALPLVPQRVQEEIDMARRHFKLHQRCLYCDVIRQETRDGARIVADSDRFVAIAPFASRRPFEVWILPRDHGSHFEDVDVDRFANLAWILRSVLRRIEKALERPAWNLVLHTAPLQKKANGYYHWHIEILPRVVRESGLELGIDTHFNPTPPEEAAAFLRNVVL